MKKMLNVMALSALLIGSQAYGAEGVEDSLAIEGLLASHTLSVEINEKGAKAAKKNKRKRKKKGIKACKRAKLSVEQKAQIKELRQEFKLKAVDLKGEVKKARLKYRFAVKDKETSKEMAAAASEEILSAKMELIKERLALKNEILFEVLKPKQRKPMLRCLKIRKLKRIARMQASL